MTEQQHSPNPTNSSSQHLLEVKNLTVFYGAIEALKGINFHVDQGEIVSLIGANGAGKTTILQTISGLLQQRSGQVIFDQVNLTKVPPHKILRMGLSQVPEGRRMFTELSVKDNLTIGAFTRKDKSEIEQDIKQMYQRFPILKERKKQLAGTLSGGEQQMLAIARSLMSHPRLLLLDEPSMGLSPVLTQTIFKIISEVSKEGTTILLVEQNANMALKISQRAYVLETGKIVMSGPAKELAHNPKIKASYLGN